MTHSLATSLVQRLTLRPLHVLPGILLLASFSRSLAEDAPLVRVSTKTEGSVVGELIRDEAEEIEVFNIQTNSPMTIKRTAVTRIENPLTVDDAARYAGLPAVMGRKVSVLSERPVKSGKIAKLSAQIVYLTLGRASGIEAGDKLSVYRGEGDIVDPDTGEVLASERARVAELEVTEVGASVSKARLIGELEIRLEVGDQVEPQNGKVVVAVCPLTNDDGSANATGNAMAEEFVSALVQRDVSVVERSALDMVLSELIAQNTILFDQKSAQKLGQLTGASMVLTGKIIREKTTGKAHVRLIDVATGEILLAASAPVKLSARSLSSTSRSSSSSTERESGGKANVPAPSGDMEPLGKSRSLPGFLTTSAALERTEGGGIRFQGIQMHQEKEGGIILTKERDFLNKDFEFEVLVSFGPNDGIANIGIGPGRVEGGRRAESLLLRFHAPHHGNGEVQLEGWDRGTTPPFGKVTQKGVHRVQFLKEGDTLTVSIDPENDGPTDDDLETVIPDLREFAPYLTSKNSHLFLGGSATFSGVRLTINR